MPTTHQELESFTDFAKDHLARVGVGPSLDELFDQWRFEHPSDDLHAENVAAVNAALQDIQAGDRGTPIGAHSDQLRREFGLASE